ncbi:MAG: hypothetical protein ACHQD9_03250 [Chitinophagales bacterium]
MLKKIRAAVFMMLLILFASATLEAQSTPTVLENRLCKTWKLDRTEQGSKTTPADNSLSDFVMIINSDHTVKQGMNPDGLISGTWTFDEKNMLFIVKDETTGEEYKMKVTSITTDELILEDTTSNPALFIRYSAK